MDGKDDVVITDLPRLYVTPASTFGNAAPDDLEFRDVEITIRCGVLVISKGSNPKTPLQVFAHGQWASIQIY